MNQDPPPIPDQPESAPQNEPQPTPENSTNPAGVNFDGFAKSVEDAVKNGRKDAKKLFDDALPKAKEDLSKGIHDVAYAIAYATAFTGAIIREVAPDSLVDGLREGASAGQRAANEAARSHREKQEGSSDPANDVGSVPV